MPKLDLCRDQGDMQLTFWNGSWVIFTSYCFLSLKILLAHRNPWSHIQLYLPFRFGLGGLLSAIEFYLRRFIMSLCYYWSDPFDPSTQTPAASWNVPFLWLVWKPRSLSQWIIALIYASVVFTPTEYECIRSIHLHHGHISHHYFMLTLSTLCMHMRFTAVHSVKGERSRTVTY